MSTLDLLVADYGQIDSKIKELTKTANSEKDEIKQLMLEQDVTSHESGGYKVSCVKSTRETMDQEKMLDVLKKDWRSRYGKQECPYIRTVEIVDMDKLESVLYAGELPDSVLKELDSCRKTTEVITLKCTKAKEKKDE